MQIKEIYKKLHEFTVAATNLENKKVIFASQNALTRPKKPFITIAASSFKNTGTPIKEGLDAAGKMTQTLPMSFVVSFQAFSDVMHEAEELLSAIHSELWTELQNRIFKGEMAAHRVVKPVTSMPMIMSEQVEYRAILEVQMSYMKTTKYQVGFIETLEIDGVINEQKIQIKRKLL
jgi:hypothetical protein